MADGLLSIGAFSRASLLSVKALRNYHRAGILVPARVDPDTGYRAYHATQLTDAAVLRRLRGLDLPLAQVGEILRARDPDVTRRVLAAHGQLLREQLARTARAVEELQTSLAHPSSQTPVHVRDEPGLTVIQQRGRVREGAFAPFLDAAYPALYARLDRCGLRPSGPPGALYPLAVDDVDDVVAYVPLAAERLTGEPEPLPVAELPGATVAVLTHHGGYDTIGGTYELLGRWIAEYAVPAEAQVREVYVVGPTESDDPVDFRTDICWPLAAPMPQAHPTRRRPS